MQEPFGAYIDRFKEEWPRYGASRLWRHPGPMDALHRFASRAYRSKDLPARTQALLKAGLWLWWPPYAWRLGREWSREHGTRVERLCGKSPRRQRLELAWLALRYGVTADKYYELGLYAGERRHTAHEYLFQEERLILFAALSADHRAASFNKFPLFARCRAADLPVVPVLCVFDDGRGWLHSGEWPPRHDLFVKLARGSRGTNAMLWRRLSDGRYRNQHGVALDSTALWRYLERLSRTTGDDDGASATRDPEYGFDGGFVVQRALRNHPAIQPWSNGHLITFRLITVCPDSAPSAPIDIVAAMVRIPTGEAITSNDGALAMGVDLDSGAIKAGVVAGAPLPERVTCHPDSGEVLRGKVVPQWQEMLALARRAHGLFPGQLYIGWDLVLTEEGVQLLEGNAYPMVETLQKIGPPFGPTPFLAPILARIATVRPPVAMQAPDPATLPPVWLDALERFTRRLPKVCPCDRLTPGRALPTLRRLARARYRSPVLAPGMQTLLRHSSALWWPIRAWFLSADAPAAAVELARTRSGKGAPRQRAERFLATAGCGLDTATYYQLGLFERGRYRTARHYITQRLHERLMDLANLAAAPHYLDKVPFQRLARGKVAMPELLAVFWAGRTWPVEGVGTWPPAGDLFVKISGGLMGCEAMHWLDQGDGRYRNSEGVTLDADALFRLLAGRSRRTASPLMVERLLRNHPAVADLSPGPVCNARIVTVNAGLEATTEVELLGALLKMPVAGDVTTNHGIGARIDPESGRLDAAFDTADFLNDELDVHPDTGARIRGREVPDWNAALALARRAHALLPGVAFIGWDIAFTDRGPVVLEGNHDWAAANLQKALGRPLGQTRYPELCRRRVAAMGRSGR